MSTYHTPKGKGQPHTQRTFTDEERANYVARARRLISAPGGSRKAAAAALGLTPSVLQRWMGKTKKMEGPPPGNLKRALQLYDAGQSFDTAHQTAGITATALRTALNARPRKTSPSHFYV